MFVPRLPEEYQTLVEAQRAHEEALLRKRNVVGVAIGHKYSGGQNTGRLCVLVLVSVKLPPDLISEDDLAPPRLGDVLTDVQETGFFLPQSSILAQRSRPAFGGLSISHGASTLGKGTLTTGCYDVSVDPGIPPRYFLLSCNHVIGPLANAAATVGSPVIQPGGGDGGSSPIDNIGKLSSWIPLQVKTGAPIEPVNFADAAIAECDIADVDREVYWIGYPRRWSVSALQAIKVGTILQKTGRTTGFTTGQVTAVNATVDVIYPPGPARFALQILTTLMSQDGDSGSLVCNLDGVGVGMLFAGSTTDTLISPLNFAENYLGVRISAHPLF